MKPRMRDRPEVPAKRLLNRTGVMASPIDSTAQAEASLATRVLEADGQGLVHVRAEYEGDARPVGSLPPPTDLADLFGAETARRANVLALIDKVGERLAFERTGVRLYQALIGKLDSRGSFAGGPTKEELIRFQKEERNHFQLLCTAITMLGGDPTAVSPSADLVAVSSSGLTQVLSDPRTTLAQALEAILVAELVDNDSWELLIQMTRAAGRDSLADAFLVAKAEEDVHLGAVRDWLSAHGGLVMHGADVERSRRHLH
jgi:ferritin-like protein